jgi:hypothetical protein
MPSLSCTPVVKRIINFDIDKGDRHRRTARLLIRVARPIAALALPPINQAMKRYGNVDAWLQEQDRAMHARSLRPDDDGRDDERYRR